MKNFVCTINIGLSYFFQVIYLAIILIILCSGFSPAKVIYVNSKAAGNNDGTSWTNAYTDLYTALLAASSGDSLWVAKGTYFPSLVDRSISFHIPDGVKVFGGFAGNETNFNNRDYKNNVTTLSGEKINYHVVDFINTGSSTALDGFTIKEGWADTTIPATLDSLGGGILIKSTNGHICSPTINNCLITNNLASYEGGGVCIYSEAGGTSSPTFNLCNINNNKGVLKYFGVVIIDTSFNTINGVNAIGLGGGVAIDASMGTCNPTFNDCSIDSNRYVIGGGGMYNDGGSPIMNNCSISYNGDDNSYLVVSGGGIYSLGGTLKLTGCTISYDSALFNGSAGGGIFMFNHGNTSLYLTNDTISNNNATGGGGIDVSADSSNKVTGAIKNSVISNNSAFISGGISIFTIDSSIINLSIDQCKINDNRAYREGGGIEIGDLGNSQCIPVFTNCKITGNSVNNSSGKGAGIYNRDGSSPTFANCTVSEDSAAYGGGIYNSLFNAGNIKMKPVFTDCIISGNYASINGGGIFSRSAVDTLSVSLINCIISGNYADSLGGGIYTYANSSGGYYNNGMIDTSAVVNSTLMNCTITGNYAGTKGGAMFNHGSRTGICNTTIKNSIIWDDIANGDTASSDASAADSLALPEFSYSIIANSRNKSGVWFTSLGVDDGHNIDQDPLFKTAVDPSTAPSTNGDFHLTLGGPKTGSGSPALGKGSPKTDANVPITDIEGNPRPLPDTALRVDMGAYEEDEYSLLPVELTSFSANVNNLSVDLKWTTATETNNYGFEIQRYNPPLNPLPGGKEKGWVKIGFVKGVGSATTPNHYSFVDKNPEGNGKIQYRLKQIDFNGTFKYSKTIEVSLSTPIKFALEQNYPNPFNPTTTIKYDIPKAEHVTLNVYDILGNVVETLVNKEQQPGRYSVQLSEVRHQLSSGVYLYRLTAGNFIQVKKMVLLK